MNPWYFSHEESVIREECPDQWFDELVCELSCSAEPEKNIARAHLISAAPELLKGAQLSLRIAEGWIHDQLDGTSLFNKEWAELEPVRAAIAKATGEQP